MYNDTSPKYLLAIHILDRYNQGWPRECHAYDFFDNGFSLMCSPEWKGSAPICALTPWGHADCPSGTQELTYSKFGAGGEAQCQVLQGFKSLCCSQPPPYQNCVWQRHDNSWNFGFPLVCATQCQPGKTPIASDPEFCITGASLFCCDAPTVSVRPIEFIKSIKAR